VPDLKVYKKQRVMKGDAHVSDRFVIIPDSEFVTHRQLTFALDTAQTNRIARARWSN
jgi:hypothetical protein